jgi:hypothetical protein
LRGREGTDAEIIDQGPLLPLFGDGGAPRQSNFLPKNALKVYDSRGVGCDLLFEEEAIFSNPENGDPERIFYPEIKGYRFSPIEKYRQTYAQLTLSTKFGMRSFFFVPSQYRDVISRILSPKRYK